MPGRKSSVEKRRARRRSRSIPRGASRLPLVRRQFSKRPNVGIERVNFARSCVRSARRPSWPGQPLRLRTPTRRPRTSQARPVGRLPLRPPTPENPRAPRIPRRQFQAPSPQTRLRTPSLGDFARARTRVFICRAYTLPCPFFCITRNSSQSMCSKMVDAMRQRMALSVALPRSPDCR